MLKGTQLAGFGTGVPAWQRVLNLAKADGWEFCYDYTNPSTLTLDGESEVSDLLDGLGNRAKLRQTTDTLRPAISRGRFGQLDGALYNQAPYLFTPAAEWTSFAGPAAYIILATHVTVLNVDARMWNFHATTGSNQNLTFLSSARCRIQGSLTLTTAIDVQNTNPTVVTGIYNGASSKLIHNNVEVAAGDAGTHANDGNSVGARFGGAVPVNSYLGAKLGRTDADATKIARMQDLLHVLTGIAKG